jgi:hypothetical protein
MSYRIGGRNRHNRAERRAAPKFNWRGGSPVLCVRCKRGRGTLVRTEQGYAHRDCAELNFESNNARKRRWKEQGHRMDKVEAE